MIDVKITYISGRCEICGVHSPQLYYARQSRSYTQLDGNIGETYEGCENKFGHFNCIDKFYNE